MSASVRPAAVDVADPRFYFPPSPHDPRARTFVERIGAWQIRLDAGARGVQLWSPDARVSIVMPARAASADIGNAASAGWHFLFLHFAVVPELVWDAYGLHLPGPSRLAAIRRWFANDALVDPARCELAVLGALR